METLLIHDLTPKQLSAVLPDTSGYTIIDANRSAAFCQGCFRCWLASPGRCVMKDSLQTVSAQIGNAEAVIVLSRCCFGGFSPGVKRLLDRAIACSLPFFTYRGGSTIRCAIKIALRFWPASMARLRTLSVKQPHVWPMPTGSIWAFLPRGCALRKSRSFWRR